jgi:hypothetical protein
MQILGRNVNSASDAMSLAVRAGKKALWIANQSRNLKVQRRVLEACQKGDVEEAMRVARSLDFKHNDMPVFNDAIRTLIRAGRLEDAKALYNPAHPDLLTVFAGEFLQAGELGHACDCARWAYDASGHQHRYQESLIRFLVIAGLMDEARDMASTLDANQIRETYPRFRFKDFTPEERCTTAEVCEITLAMPESIVQLIRATNYILDNKIPGAFVECGVFKGGNAIVMMRTLLNAGITDRDIYLYDTFEGFPKPEEIDFEYSHGPALETWQRFKKPGDTSEESSDWLKIDLEDVRKKILTIGYPSERIKFVKGLVENTIPGTAPDQIALLRLDTDFYRSTKHEFIHLFPRLSRGGILIIDDYGALHGARVATDEYLKENNIAFFLGRSDEHVRIGVKL